MSDLVRVTVAAGCSVTISPHPSRIPGMPALVLHGGNTLDVTREKMASLLAARLILDPATGKPVPHDPPARIHIPTGPSFSIDGGDSWFTDGRMVPSPQPDLDQINARRPIKAGPDWSPGGDAAGMIKAWDEASSDPITDAQGRSWPSY